MTLSIIAYENGLVGAAVTSCVIAAGRRILHVSPTGGACVTQASSDITWGAEILEAMRMNIPPDAAIAPYVGSEVQLAAVDFGGRIAVSTGPDCTAHAGHVCEGSASAQVNTAALPEAWLRMLSAFQAAADQPLAERLVEALAASGGDARGQQAAAVIVTSTSPFNGDAQEPHVDLRVDDHRQPVTELARLLSLHRAHLAVRQADRTAVADVARQWLPKHPDDPYLMDASL